MEREITIQNYKGWMKLPHNDMTEEEIEAHRKASPFKVGHEPDYERMSERLPRKKKKKLKKWIAEHDEFSIFPMLPHVQERFKDKRIVRRTYEDLYAVMVYMNNKPKIEASNLKD